jgi:hypothetical protein
MTDDVANVDCFGPESGNGDYIQIYNTVAKVAAEFHQQVAVAQSV